MNTIRAFYRFLLPIRFSLIALAVLTITLIFTDQGHDIIAYLAEDDPLGKDRDDVRWLFLGLVLLLALQTWYWSRQLLRVKYPDQPDAKNYPLTVEWLPRLLGFAVFVIVFIGLNIVRKTYGGAVDDPARELRWMMLVLAIEAALFVIGVWLRRKWLERGSDQEKATDQKESARQLGKPALILLALMFVFGLVFLIVSIAAVQVVGRIGSFSILFLSLGLWIVLGGAIVYFGMMRRIPILTWLFVFAILISPLTDNHKIRNIAGSEALVTGRSTTGELFDKWLAANPSSLSPRPVFIVATEGGGIRAAYWTAAVLASLSDTVPGFTEHLFAISSVSGGSVGATTYRSLLAERTPTNPTIRQRARDMLAYDALAPTLAAFTQQDFLQRFVPVPFLPDRAAALTGGWQEGWTGAVGNGNDRYGKGFLATARANETKLPALYCNGTGVELGQRIIISNAAIDANFANAVDIFNATGFDMAMSVGALNGARFPYISPAGTLLRNPKMDNRAASLLTCGGNKPCDHVVDGGYFENSGAVTAADVVRIVQSRPNVQPYVIFITYTPIPKPVEPEKWANEILSPPRTLLSVRGARGVTAVDQLRALVGTEHTIEFILDQNKAKVQLPLGWLLSLRTRNLIDAQMPGSGGDSNWPDVAKVAALLGTAPTTDAVYTLAVNAEATARKTDR